MSKMAGPSDLKDTDVEVRCGLYGKGLSFPGGMASV